jgi:enoyl-CoA hydratase/carnithine racemase
MEDKCMTLQSDARLVRYERRERVAIITLNRPEKRNAFNADLVRALREALMKFDADSHAYAAVLCGAGKAFSSGADVQERQMRTPEEFRRLGGPQEPDAHTGDLFVRSVNWKPVVAAVHGVVMGLGLGVAFECDLVVADVSTRFQITETPRGLGGARFWSLLHFCGAASFASEVALTGRFFSAQEAHNAGLVCRVAPDGEAVETALGIAAQIASNPPLSVQSTVRIRRWFMDQAERMAVALTDPMKLYLTEDFKEAVAAFSEKRDPREFNGR